MTVAVQMPQGGGLAEDILKGLNIAQTIFGIKADKAKYEQMASDRKVAQAKQGGALTGEDVSKAQLAGAVVSDKAFDGSNPFKMIGPDGTVSEKHIRTPRQAQDRQPYRAADGTNRIGFVVNNKVVQSPDDPLAANQPRDDGLSEAGRLANEDRDAAASDRKEKERKEALERGAALASKATEKSRTMIDAAEQVTSLAETATTNPYAKATLPVQMNRMIGNMSSLSDTEQAAFGGSKAIMDQMNQAIEEAKTGTLSETNKKFITDLANVMRRNAKKQLMRENEKAAKKHAKIWGGTVEEAYEIFADSNLDADKEEIKLLEATTHLPQQGGKVGGYTVDEIAAERKRRDDAKRQYLGPSGLRAPGTALGITPPRGP